MPITKERLEALITAAEAIEQQFIFTSNRASGLAQAALQGDITPAAALEEIITIATAPEFQIFQPILKIREERQHWRLTHRRNDADKRRRAGQRRLAGIPSRELGQGILDSLDISEAEPAAIAEARRLAAPAIAQGLPPGHYPLPSLGGNGVVQWDCPCGPMAVKTFQEWLSHLPQSEDIPQTSENGG